MINHVPPGLSSDTTEKARMELNENPDTLHQDIKQVPPDRTAQKTVQMMERNKHSIYLKQFK